MDYMEQRKLNRINRHTYITAQQIKTAPPIMEKFGVCRQTALTDLADIWGVEAGRGMRRRAGKVSQRHCNIWLADEEYEALAAAAQALDCSVSEAVRIAIQEQYLRHTESFKNAASGEVR